MKQILLFIIIILILGIFYIYGLYLEQKKHNKNNNIYTTPEIINPTFQFSTELNNKQVNNNNIKISNVEIYDDLLINNDKYYFDREKR